MKYLSEYRDAEQGILMTVKQLESGIHKLENQYSRIVRPEGNPQVRAIIESVFEISDREWRGIGNIPESGYELKPAYQSYDANLKFDIGIAHVPENEKCIAGKILKGIKKPYECPQFGKKCTPQFPLGTPMVSSEGACAAYSHFSNMLDQQLVYH